MVRRWVRWLAVLASASASGPLAGGRARAAETTTPYALSYQAAPGCPAEAAFRKDTLAHVHDTAGSAGARVAVSIEKRNDAFHGELVATDEEGHEGRRAIDGATCADVAHALAFLAGLAIELGGHLEKPETEPKPKPEPAQRPPVAPPAAVVRPPPSQKAVEPDGMDWSTAALGEVRTGLTPEVRPALQVALDLEGRHPHLLAHAYRLGVVGAVGELQGAGGTATLRYLAGRIDACPLRFGETRLVFRACLAFELGYVWAESHAATNPHDEGQVWPTGEALVRAKYTVTGGFFVEADVGVGVPMLRPSYFFEPNQVLYEVPVVTARAALGLGYRF